MNYADLAATELIAEIRKDFKAHWELNDPAHRENHFEDVHSAGLDIARRLGMDLQKHDLWRDILVVAYFHDLFTWSRVNHHTLIGEWVMSTDHPLFVELYPRTYERRRIAKACAEHRASFKGISSGRFSDLMSAADRGMPGNLNAMIARSEAYHLHRGETPEEAAETARQHMKEKFGRNGYARYPELYREVFATELNTLWDQIDAL